MKHTSKFTLRRLLVLLLALASAAKAATYNWTGQGFIDPDYLWSQDFNWAGGVSPAPGEANVTIVFPNNASPKVTTNDIVGLKVASIQFQGSNYVVHGKPAGNALTLYGSGLGGWATIASFNGNQFATTCPLVLSNSGFVAVATNCMLSVWSSMSGSGGLTKSSPGTLRYTAFGANTYTGTTYVGDGTLELFNGTSSANTAVAIAGPLSIGGTNAAYSPLVKLLFNEQIGNTTPVSVYHNGELWLNGHDDTVGSLTVVDGATVTTGLNGGVNSPGLLTLNGNLTNSTTLNAQYASIYGRLDLGLFTRTFQVDDYVQINADISGGSIFNPGITKTGPGNLNLGGENSYSGPTLVQEGRLTLYYDSTPGNTNAGTTIAAGSTLDLYGSSVPNETLVLNGQANVTSVYFAGGTNVWSGPVTLNGPCSLSCATGPDPEQRNLTFSGAIGGTGSLRQTGHGWVTFSGFANNTYTGGFFCEEGSAYFNKSASAAALSGPLNVGTEGGSGAVVRELQINQIPNSVPVTVFDNSYFTLEPGVTETIGPLTIMGGTVFVDGILTLSGEVTNRFSTNIFGFLGGVNGSIVLPSTRIVHCETNALLFGGSIWSGSGGVTKTGPGELSLYGLHTYTGATIIKEGTLRLSSGSRPGSTAAGTVIEANGVLYLYDASVTNESLTLYGGGNDNGVALIYENTNVWSGPVEVHSGVNINAVPPAKLSIIGTITGDGGLTHIGNGALTFGGNSDNTYTGTTTFRAGTFNLSKNGAFAIPHSLTVGYSTNGAPAAVVKCTGAAQLTPLLGFELGLGGVTLNPSATLDCGGFNQTVANLYLKDGKVDTGGGVLSLAGNLDVQVGTSTYSYLFGNVQLTTGASSSHIFNVVSNGHLYCTATITESGTQNIYKDGDGEVGNLGQLNFNGTLTVHKGTWFAANTTPFGTAAGPTIVDAGGTLYAFAGSFNEPLQLAGSGAGGLGALRSNSTNSFSGPITLTFDAMIGTDTNAILSLSGAINGAGGLTKQGGGTLQLLGSAPNSYAGMTLVTSGKLELGKTNVNAVAGPLTVMGPNSSTYVRLLQPEQIGNLSPVVLQDTGWIALDGQNETIGSLSGVGAIYQSAQQTGLLTVGGNETSTSFFGTIHGGGGLTKTGGGTFTLAANNLYTGTTTVNAGKLLVNGQQPQSAVSILTAGTLGGTGRVGHINDLNGHIVPGTSPGILVCSNFSTFTPANSFQIEIAGTTPGIGHDQLQVNGSILLMGGTLQVAMNFAGGVSNQYVIISNDGADAVSGSFTGLPEGAMLTNNGAVLQITYHGGDGNDVMLIQKSTGPSQITSVQRIGGTLQLSGLGSPNTLYRVEAATNLNSPIFWTVIGDSAANEAGMLQFSDPNASQFPMRFYRLRFP